MSSRHFLESNRKSTRTSRMEYIQENLKERKFGRNGKFMREKGKFPTS